MRRILPLLALAFLPLLAPVPTASADEAFDTLKKEFAGKVAARGDVEERVNLVTRVASYGDRDGARLLADGLLALGDRVEKDAAAFAELLEQYEEVNSPIDVMKDDYKTRTDLQNRIMAEEEARRQDRRVFETFRDALALMESAEAISEAGSRIRRDIAPVAKEIAAEGLAANPAALESALRLAREKDERILIGVLRGLRGRTGDPVFKLAVESLKSGSWPVRLAAVGLLEGMNEPRVLKPLIEAVGREEGRLRDDVRDALRRLTHQNIDADYEEWKRWYGENLADIEGEGPKTALFGAFKGKGEPTKKKSVYGIDTRSRRILFVIDASGSMKNPITGKEKPGGTSTGLSLDDEMDMTGTKIEIAKRELKRAIRALESDALFNIIAYGTNVVRWKPNMVKADMSTKNEAYLFVRDMEAVGGTWTYGALQEAFKIAGMGATDKRYDPTVDTVYLISDGAPTDNDMLKPQFMEADVILDAVREWNRIGGVVIHAVAVDTKAAGGTLIAFMKNLAAQNGGQYTQRD